MYYSRKQQKKTKQEDSPTFELPCSSNIDNKLVREKEIKEKISSLAEILQTCHSNVFHIIKDTIVLKCENASQTVADERFEKLRIYSVTDDRGCKTEMRG